MAVVGERIVLLYIGEHRKKITFCGFELEHLVKAIRQNNQIDFQESILFQIWDDDFNEFIDLDPHSEIPNKSKIKVVKVNTPHPPQKSLSSLPSTMTINSSQPPLLIDSYISTSQTNEIIDTKPTLPINQNQNNTAVSTNENQAIAAMNANQNQTMTTINRNQNKSLALMKANDNHALALMNTSHNQALALMNTNQHMMVTNQIPLMINSNQQLMPLNSSQPISINTDDDPVLIAPPEYRTILPIVDITLESDSPSPDDRSGVLDIKSQEWDPKNYQLPKFSLHLQKVLNTKESISKQDRHCIVKELFQSVSKYTWYPDRYYSFVIRELISKYPHLRDHSHMGYRTWLSDLKIKFSNERRKLNEVEECVKKREFFAKNKKSTKEDNCIPAEPKNDDNLLQITNVLSTSSDSPSSKLNESVESENPFANTIRSGGKLKNIHNYQLPEFSDRIMAALENCAPPTRRLKRWIIHELFLDLIQYYTWYPTQLYPRVIVLLFKKYPHLKSNVFNFNIWLGDLKMKFGNERRKLNEDFRASEKELSKSLKNISQDETKGKANAEKQVADCSPADEKNEETSETANAVSTSSDRSKSISKYELPEFSPKVTAALKIGVSPTRRTKWWIIEEIFQDLRQYSECPTSMNAQIIMMLFKKYPHLKSDSHNFDVWVTDLKEKFRNENPKLDVQSETELDLETSRQSTPMNITQDDMDYDKQGQSREDSSDCSIVNEKWSLEPLNCSYVSTTTNQLVPVDTKLSFESNEDVEVDSQMKVDSQTHIPQGYQLPPFTLRLRDVLNGDEVLTRKHKRWIVEEIFIDLSQYTWYPQNCRDIVSSLLTTYPSLEIDGISFNTWLSDLKMKFANERRKLNKVDLFYAKQSAKFDGVLMANSTPSEKLPNKETDKS